MTKESLQKASQVHDTLDTLQVWIGDLKERQALSFIYYGNCDGVYLSNVKKEIYAAALKIFKKHEALKAKEFADIK
jgi:hypothetical protein